MSNLVFIALLDDLNDLYLLSVGLKTMLLTNLDNIVKHSNNVC